jgi:hypothetical protein
MPKTPLFWSRSFDRYHSGLLIIHPIVTVRPNISGHTEQFLPSLQSNKCMIKKICSVRRSKRMINDSKNSIKDHQIVSHEDWLSARMAFLEKEKEFTRLKRSTQPAAARTAVGEGGQAVRL